MKQVKLTSKKGSTLHDYPYTVPGRKCPHFWIINVTPPGPAHCIHRCLYCYARQAIYSDYSAQTLVYNNLPELVEKDLKKINLCPPISISNVSDPCQPIPELRTEVRRLIQLLMSYGVGFSLTTKGDPGFLLDLPGFVAYGPKFIAITIEGTADVLSLLSPAAPPLEKRLKVVHRLSGLGIDTLIRFDPVFIHLFQALYGSSWFQPVEELIRTFASTGAKHIVCSTGRLSKKSAHPYSAGASLWERMLAVIQRQSTEAARRFEQEYRYERGGTSQGYLLRRDIRLEFHHRLKVLVEENGMTYATCQELSAEESDSPGLPHCERFLLPFARKQADGRFKVIEGCTANCHVSCRNLASPLCGQPKLVSPRPFMVSYLKVIDKPQRLIV
ncbi:MAG TPA: radical SAM protein [Dehalococcoidales bacterium]|nr:radical SAM protein [Dehalococcoidales bacterium]